MTRNKTIFVFKMGPFPVSIVSIYVEGNDYSNIIPGFKLRSSGTKSSE